VYIKKGKKMKLKMVNGQKKKKKSKFWLMRMPRLEVLLNFVPNPRKISPFGKKKLFKQNLGLVSVMAATKT